MSFTRALYYPTIDIKNWSWTKSAALFWDKMQTIVPESIQNPYQERTTRILQDEGILIPYTVNPDLPLVRDLAQDVSNFLETTEGFDYLIKNENGGSIIHLEKLPRDVREFVRVHPEKLPNAIREKMEAEMHDGFLHVNGRFAKFYMSLLANKICEQDRLVLLTDDNLASNVTQKSRLDNQRRLSSVDRYDYRYSDSTLNLTQGLLMNLALKGIRFSPDTKIEEILRFKRNHQDELGLFRVNLEKLVNDIPEGQDLESIQRQISDIYTDEFLPAYNGLKNALDGFKLKWISDHIMKIAFFNTGTTALLPHSFGTSIPQALGCVICPVSNPAFFE